MTRPPSPFLPFQSCPHPVTARSNKLQPPNRAGAGVFTDEETNARASVSPRLRGGARKVCV